MAKTKGKKAKKIILGVLLGLVLAIGIFLIVWFLGDSYPEFEEIAQEDAPIAYLEDGFIPQGLAPLPQTQDYDFIASGYMKDDSPSRLCLLDSQSEQCKYVEIKHEGKILTSHFGGVTLTQNFVYVTSGKSVVRISLIDILSAKDGSTVEAYDSFKTDINNAYCYYYEKDQLLFVGEFYRPGNYETAESHHITKNGETNYAFIYAFAVDESKEGGIASNIPVKALSVREQVQGIAVDEKGIFLSCSYGLPASGLYCYENKLMLDTPDHITVQEQKVPLYRLDGTNLVKELEMPSMSEEVCIRDGNLYVLFESACNKYKYFTRERIYNVFAIALDKLV